VADDERIYITGQSHEYALAPRGSPAAKEDARADRKREKKQQ
jgi:hypothetical protein